MRLGFGDREFTEMEDRGGKHRAGMTVAHSLDQVVKRADTAGGDNRDTHGIGYRAGQREIESIARAIAIHAGQQDFARASRRHVAAPTG